MDKYGSPPLLTEDSPETESAVEVTVDDVSIMIRDDEPRAYFMPRGMLSPDTAVVEPRTRFHRTEYVREWVVDRRIEGRRYHRSDRLVMVRVTR